MVIIYILFLAIFILLTIIGMICIKIKSVGMNVKDFFQFIFAINDLNNLYVFSKTNKKMSNNEQKLFLEEAEKIFSIFEKIPSMIWEDEYEKYEHVLDTYKDIRVLRWSNANA